MGAVLPLMTYCAPGEMLGSEKQGLLGQEKGSHEVRVKVPSYKPREDHEAMLVCLGGPGKDGDSGSDDCGGVLQERCRGPG